MSANPQGTITYQVQYRKCRPRCGGCQEGQGHGPYYYAYWREDGKLKSRCFGRVQPPGFALPSRRYRKRGGRQGS
jgi:hypothetical protein